MGVLPLISIIIPTYNSEQHLKECFDSVVNQTYENLEVIVIDGGSTDNTQLIINEYTSKNNNWLSAITNKGVSHQRNVGLDIFKGEYLFFLDSDDFISSNLIKDLYLKLKKDDLDLVTPEIHNIFLNGNILIETKIIEPQIINNVTQYNFFEHAYESFLGGPTKLFRRKLVKGIKHNELLSNGEDLLFNYQMVKNNGTIKYDVCKGTIYYYRHDISVVNPADRRLNKNGYLFCNEMVAILENMDTKDKNFYGALKILDIQLLLFMKAYLNKRKIIPHTLKKARKYMFINTKKKSRYYYLFPRLFNVINALIH